MPATDVELVRGALAGSEWAFREIVLRYQAPVYRLMVRMMRDPSRSEELAQDTFVKAFRSLHTYDAQRKFAAWLLAIARNVAIDELRRGKLHTLPLEKPDSDGMQIRETLEAAGPTPALVTERLELARALETAVACLRPEYREIVTLRHEHELDYGEIAQITGMPVGTIKSSLHRARKELAEHMERLGWSPAN